MSPRPRRILLYCAGRSGIGQTVRAARIASYIRDLLDSRVEILIVTGVRYGDQVFRSPRWHVIVPPEIVRVVSGAADGEDGERLAALRESAARAVASMASGFRPDIFISTSHRGVVGEITEVADSLRDRGCRLVLALRDIYHPPEFVGDFRAMSAAEFDLVLIGGPPAVRRWAPEGLLDGSLAPKADCVGYLRPLHAQPGQAVECGSLIVRCQVGGGRDGAPLAKAVIEAVDSIRRDAARPLALYLSTGPLMCRSDVQALKSMSGEHTHVRIWSDAGAPPSARSAPSPHLVVSMAGYNSCVEAAWTGMPSILVPREDPGDLEQLIRAELFSDWFANIAVARRDPEGIANSISAVLFSAASSEDAQSSTRPDNVFALPQRVALTVLGQL